MTLPQILSGPDRRLLIVCDHASNSVPAGIELGVSAAALEDHIAWDIGTAKLSQALARQLQCSAILATVSRLVVDCNRHPDHSVPESSDGRAIPGNIGLDRQARARRLAIHADYHGAIATAIAEQPPQLVIAIHSFTPELQSGAGHRPWPIALLWNRDERAPKLALPALRSETCLSGPVGANEPYSGRDLNYTMDRHAEDNGIPYLTFEVRQDQLRDSDGIARYAGILQRATRAAVTGL